MNVYSIDLQICATAYVKGTTPEAAHTALSAFIPNGIEIAPQDAGGIIFSGEAYDSPDLPAVSLSPAMTMTGIWPDDAMECVYAPASAGPAWLVQIEMPERTDNARPEIYLTKATAEKAADEAVSQIFVWLRDNGYLTLIDAADYPVSNPWQDRLEYIGGRTTFGGDFDVWVHRADIPATCDEANAILTIPLSLDIWTLVIDDDAGTHVSAFQTERDAREALFEYVCSKDADAVSLYCSKVKRGGNDVVRDNMIATHFDQSEAWYVLEKQTLKL